MKRDLLEGLTDAQRDAVCHRDGPCLVVAGPGTGKTTVVTRRIAYLIQEAGVPADQIAALTFTDKAAREMEERVDNLVEYGETGATIATFHSFCADLVKRHAFLLGIDPASRLLTAAEEISFLRQHIDELPTALYKPAKNPVEFLGDLSGFISKAKDDYLQPEAIAAYAKEKRKNAADEGEAEEMAKLEELAACYATVNRLFAEGSVLSYADLIFHAVTLLNDFPSVRRAERQRFTYLMVDEFQDTNFIQSEVARLLAGEGGNVMVVGDDDQAIYSFRGANLKNILGFTKTFPGTTIITLKDNYRSTQAILDAAYALIQHNNPERLEAQEQIDKRLVSHAGTGERPAHWHYERGGQEYRAIADEARRLITEEKYRPEEIAVLVRSRAHARGLETVLRDQGIPYQYVGDGRFYQQPYIQAVLRPLRLLADPYDDANLFTCLGEEPFSVGLQALQKRLGEARYLAISLWEHLGERTGEEDAALRESHAFLRRFWEQNATASPAKALVAFLDSSGWYARLKELPDGQPLELLATLYQEMSGFEATHPGATAAAYVRHIDYLLATDEDVAVNQAEDLLPQGLQIMTVHKSKGLEFRAVFVPNLVQGRFPGRNTGERLPAPRAKDPEEGKPSNLPEERRLAFVAMTRAKERLYLASSELYDDRKTKAKLSPFVVEALSLHAAPQPASFPAAELVREPERLEAMASEAGPKPQSAPGKPATYSASSLETYARCPWQYHYQYVLRLKVPSSWVSNFGTSVHETLRRWFTARKAGEIPAIDELYRQSWIRGGYPTKKTEEQEYARGLAKVKEYLANLPADFVPFAVEQGVKAVLPDGNLLSGKVDRIDRLPDGSVRIIDYKTGERVLTPKEAAESLPLAAYALAVAQKGEAVREAELRYIMVGEQVSVPIERLHPDAFQDKAATLIRAIEGSVASNSFPAKPDKKSCEYCDYREICPFRYGRGVPAT